MFLYLFPLCLSCNEFHKIQIKASPKLILFRYTKIYSIWKLIFPRKNISLTANNNYKNQSDVSSGWDTLCICISLNEITEGTILDDHSGEIEMYRGRNKGMLERSEKENRLLFRARDRHPFPKTSCDIHVYVDKQACLSARLDTKKGLRQKKFVRNRDTLRCLVRSSIEAQTLKIVGKR